MPVRRTANDSGRPRTGCGRPSNIVLPSCCAIEVLPCIRRSARTTLPPKCVTRHWWPRHTPSIGMRLRKRRDHVDRHARVFGPARPRRDDEVRRLDRARLVDRDLVVAIHDHLRAQRGERLHQVVGERVVVVDQQHAHYRPSPAISSARRRIALFASTSRYSFAGTESATMPAPAWKLYSSPENTSVRIVIAWSMSPLSPK